jgi:hypothetical protein
MTFSCPLQLHNIFRDQVVINLINKKTIVVFKPVTKPNMCCVVVVLICSNKHIETLWPKSML